MREDMFKVIVERPRYKNWYMDKYNHKRDLSEGDYDDMPFRSPMKPKCKLDSKELNENLKPLQRYLQKQVGKDWNDVYADICANLNKNSAVQLHVFQHLEDFVYTNTKIVNDRIVISKYECYLEDFGYSDFFYVDPYDNILKHCKNKNKYKAVPAQKFEKINEDTYLKQKDGVWYVLYTRPIDYWCKQRMRTIFGKYDCFENNTLDKLNLRTLYGYSDVFCYKIEKASRKVLIKHFGFKEEFKKLAS